MPGASTHGSFLPIPVPPQITGPREPLTQISVIQNGEATLECNATGKPPPSVMWERDGQPVGTEPGLRLQNQSLHVERAQAAHAGRYSCVAENPVGRAERWFALSVRGEDRRPAGGGGRKQGQPGEDKASSLSRHPSGLAAWWLCSWPHLALPGGGLLGEAFNTALRSGLASNSPTAHLPPSRTHCSPAPFALGK